MQNIEEKFEARDPAVVSTWQFLIKEWDAAFAKYRSAVEDCATMKGLQVSAAKRESEAKEALARLTEIKLQIDQLITDGGRCRTPISDSIVVADLDTGEVHTVSVADASDRNAPAPASKANRLVDWLLRRWSVSL